MPERLKAISAQLRDDALGEIAVLKTAATQGDVRLPCAFCDRDNAICEEVVKACGHPARPRFLAPIGDDRADRPFAVAHDRAFVPDRPARVARLRVRPQSARALATSSPAACLEV